MGHEPALRQGRAEIAVFPPANRAILPSWFIILNLLSLFGMAAVP